MLYDIHNLNLIFQDGIVFWLIQLMLLIVFVVAVVTEYFNKGSGRIVTRGSKSRNIFYIFYGIVSIILMQVIQISSVGVGYKVFITLTDLLVLLYLCLFNSWSRNKIMGIYAKFEGKLENL